MSWSALSNDLTQITKNHHPRGINRLLFEFVLNVVLDYLGGALGPHLSRVWDDMIIILFYLRLFYCTKKITKLTEKWSSNPPQLGWWRRMDQTLCRLRRCRRRWAEGHRGKPIVDRSGGSGTVRNFRYHNDWDMVIAQTAGVVSQCREEQEDIHVQFYFI